MTDKSSHTIALSFGMVWGGTATWIASFIVADLWLLPVALAVLFVLNVLTRRGI